MSHPVHARIDNLIAEYNAQYGKNSQQSLQLATSIYEESIAASYQRGIALGLLYLANINRLHCNYAESERQLTDAVERGRTACTPFDRIKILQGLGSLCTDLKRKDDACAALEEAISLACDAGITREEAVSNLMLANVFLLTDIPDDAILHSRRALTLFSEAQDERGIASSFANLGTAYAIKREPERALEYCGLASKYFLELHSPYNIAALKCNLGDIYIQMGDYSRALTYFDSAVSWIGPETYPYLLNSIYSSRFEAYYMLGQMEEAEESLRLAYECGEKAHAPGLIENCRALEARVKARTASPAGIQD